MALWPRNFKSMDLKWSNTKRNIYKDFKDFIILIKWYIYIYVCITYICINQKVDEDSSVHRIGKPYMTYSEWGSMS